MRNEDITFLLQGAYDRLNTPTSVETLRKTFPGSKIMLSTWEGTSVPGNLQVDDCIFSKDPGGYKDPLVNFTNNLSRQIISTRAGLFKVKSKYVAKMRTDLAFFNDSLRRTTQLFPIRNKADSLFKNKILIPSYFTKRHLTSGDGELIQPTPFHFSDWFSFGLTEDVSRLFEIRLPEEPENSFYFAKKKYYTNKVNLMAAAHRYAPEQYIHYSFYKKNHPNPINFENYLDFSNESIVASDKHLVNNFIVLSPRELGFYCLKIGTGQDCYKAWSMEKKRLPYLLWDGLVRREVYEILYKRHCDPLYQTKSINSLKYLYEHAFIGRAKKCHLP